MRWPRFLRRQTSLPVRPPEEHSFVYEENSAGALYGYCTRCRRYEDEVRPNEFHGPIACIPA